MTCMYYVYMRFPQMRHCNIAHVCMYGVPVSRVFTQATASKPPAAPREWPVLFVCMYVRDEIAFHWR